MQSHNPSRRSLLGGILAGLFGWLPSKSANARPQRPNPMQMRTVPASGGCLVFESSSTFTENGSATFSATDSFLWTDLPATALRCPGQPAQENEMSTWAHPDCSHP